MTKIDLTRGEIATLLHWSEDATKGNFSLGDDTTGLTWEEEALIKKLKQALEQSKK